MSRPLVEGDHVTDSKDKLVFEIQKGGVEKLDVAPCNDCGVHTAPIDPSLPWEWYMVHNHVWHQAGMPRYKQGYLCVGCLEKRLGRELRREDFDDAPINGTIPMFGTERIKDRFNPT